MYKKQLKCETGMLIFVLKNILHMHEKPGNFLSFPLGATCVCTNRILS